MKNPDENGSVSKLFSNFALGLLRLDQSAWRNVFSRGIKEEVAHAELSAAKPNKVAQHEVGFGWEQ